MDNKMDNNNFIKVDGDKIINIKYIRWVKKIDECLQICNKSNGCDKYSIHNLCKYSNYDSYMKLNKLFEDAK